jgi:hypothetical protein
MQQEFLEGKAKVDGMLNIKSQYVENLHFEKTNRISEMDYPCFILLGEMQWNREPILLDDGRRIS